MTSSQNIVSFSQEREDTWFLNSRLTSMTIPFPESRWGGFVSDCVYVESRGKRAVWGLELRVL